MKIAIQEAKKALLLGEIPIGAAIFRENQLISSAHNLKETSKKATAHAEILAIEKACEKLGDWRLDNCELFSTVEPCFMCAGAIVQARLARLYYGVPGPKFGGVVSIVSILTNQKINHKVDIFSEICDDEIGKMMKYFFEKIRQK